MGKAFEQLNRAINMDMEKIPVLINYMSDEELLECYVRERILKEKGDSSCTAHYSNLPMTLASVLSRMSGEEKQESGE